LEGGSDVNLAVLACLLRATTKKGVNFFEKKVHPRENPSYAYVSPHRKCIYSMWQFFWMEQFTVNWPERKGWTFKIS